MLNRKAKKKKKKKEKEKEKKRKKLNACQCINDQDVKCSNIGFCARCNFVIILIYSLHHQMIENHSFV